MNHQPWKQGLLVLAICTVLIALLIWDQTDRPVTTELIVEPAVMVTPLETTTTAIPPDTTTTTAPPPTTTVATQPSETEQFFACIRHRESRGDYGAVNPTGTFMGAYQFYQAGWDTFAARIGRHDLVGVPPNTVSPEDQDAVAAAAYRELGAQPWGGACQ